MLPLFANSKNYTKLFFGAKHLEKGLNRAGVEIFGAPFSKKVPFFDKKVPFLANIERSLAKWLSVCLRTKWLWVRVQLQSHIERSPKFLEYPLPYIL